MADTEKKSIIVSGYAYPTINRTVLEQWLPDLTFLNNFSYGITADGQVINLEDEEMTAAAIAAGVKPLMVLTPLDETGMFNDVTASALLSSPEARTALVNNIERTIKAKGLAGIDFDFEYIPKENRDQYVDLVRETKARLAPQGYTVMVAVAPKTSADQVGKLYEGHDYKGLGEAADYVLLMTYEWGYTYGPPMAVAPINAVRRVLDYGVIEIPREKILMGMPNYGYDWTLPFVQGESRAEKISSEEGARRAQQYGVPVTYDQVAQASTYSYTDAEGREHVVWFEDERSTRARLALVEEYGFAGVGYWNIMDYFPVNSAVLNEMYNIVKL